MYKKCPLCKGKLHHNSWYDEHGEVEYIYECCREACSGYKHHWYYGTTELRVGEFEITFADHGYLKDEDKLVAENSWKEFTKQIRFYKSKMLIK